MTALGWTWDQVGSCPCNEVMRLFEYWRKSPPVHELVKAYLGYKEPEGNSSDDSGEERENLTEALTITENPLLGGVGLRKLHPDNLPLWMQVNMAQLTEEFKQSGR